MLYWSLLKVFLNNKNTSCNTFILWNSFRNRLQGKDRTLQRFFFCRQCSLTANHSNLTTSLSFRIDKWLSSVTFSTEDIGKIIQCLDPSKAHGHDSNSICMLKVCGDTTSRPVHFQKVVLKQKFRLIFSFCPGLGR